MREVTFLPWDTEFFGKRIARLDGTHEGGAELAPAVSACLEQCIDCAYLPIAGDHFAAVHAAERAEFRLVDARLTLARAPVVTPTATRLAVAGDTVALGRIAEESHKDTRFYADPMFPREKCAELYRVWIEKSVSGYADAVVTEGPVGAPHGYVTCHLQDGVGAIRLVAVAEAHRGKGVGRRLVEGAVAWFGEQKCKRVTVATQGHNVAAQGLYQAAGFKSDSMDLWFHRWFSS